MNSRVADLRIGQTVPSQPRDLGLLGGQLVARLHGPLAGRLPGGRSSRRARSANPSTPIASSMLVGAAQLLACVNATALAAKPLAVEQVSRASSARTRTAQVVDRLAVQPVSGVAVAEQGPHAGLDPQRPPVGWSPPCARKATPAPTLTSFTSPVLDAASASSGTMKGPVTERIALEGPPGRVAGGVMTAQAIIEHGARVGRGGHTQTACRGLLQGRLDQSRRRSLLAPPGHERTTDAPRRTLTPSPTGHPSHVSPGNPSPARPGSPAAPSCPSPGPPVTTSARPSPARTASISRSSTSRSLRLADQPVAPRRTGEMPPSARHRCYPPVGRRPGRPTGGPVAAAAGAAAPSCSYASC